MRLLVFAALLFVLWVPGAYAWTWPTQGPVLLGFTFDSGHPYAGGQHRGIDIAAPAGTSLVAPVSGTVSFAGTVPTSGKSVTIETGDGYSVTLTHLGSIGVSKGASVGEGGVVGTVGPSGTPELDVPYVYMGVRVTAEAQGYLDPLAFLPALPPPVAAAPPAPPPAAPPSDPPAAESAPADPPQTESTTTETATTAAADPPQPSDAATTPVETATDTTPTEDTAPADTTTTTDAAPADAPPADTSVDAPPPPVSDVASDIGSDPPAFDPPPVDPSTAASEPAAQSEPAADTTPAPSAPAAAPTPTLAPAPVPKTPAPPPAPAKPAFSVVSPDPGFDPTAPTGPDPAATAPTAPVDSGPAAPQPAPIAPDAPAVVAPPLAPDDALLLHPAVVVSTLAAFAPLTLSRPTGPAAPATHVPRWRVVVARPSIRRRRATPHVVATPLRLPHLPAHAHVVAALPARHRHRHVRWPLFVLAALACAAAAMAVRMISSSSQPSEGAHSVAEPAEDPRRTGLAVCERPAAPRPCDGIRGPGRHLRPLSPAQGQRRPRRERDGRARDAGDGVRRPSRRVAS